MIQYPLSQPVTLRAERAALAAVAAAVQRFGADCALEPAVLARLRLVLEELFTNTVDYGDCAGTPVEILLGAEAGAVAIEYRDRGRPFDPDRDVPDDGTALPTEERRVGGLGWTLIRSLCSTVGYAREGDANVLRLCLPRAD